MSNDSIKDDPIVEFNEQVSQAIHFIVPPTEVAFIEDLKRAFEPIGIYIFEQISNGKSPRNFPLDIKFLDRVNKGFFNLLNSNANYSNIHFEYVISAFKAVFVDCIETNEIDSALNPELVSLINRRAADFKFIFGAPGEKAMLPYEDFLYNKLTLSTNTIKDQKNISFEEYFENRDLEIKKEYNKRLLFDMALIDKLDKKLRGEWFESNNLELLVIALKNKPDNMKPCFKWLKSRNSLLRLFYLLNSEIENSIEDKMLSELIGKCFLIEGKVVTGSQISVSFSKLKNTRKHSHPEVLEIERIFIECNK